MSDYEIWLEEVENAVYALLDADLDDFDDEDFEAMYEQGMDPDSVAQYLFEGEESEG